jgi:hypothetical protein
MSHLQGITRFYTFHTFHILHTLYGTHSSTFRNLNSSYSRTNKISNIFDSIFRLLSNWIALSFQFNFLNIIMHVALLLLLHLLQLYYLYEEVCEFLNFGFFYNFYQINTHTSYTLCSQYGQYI